MKNPADQGGCYPQRPKASVDNTLRDLQNSSYSTKAEFNNCFIIHSKYFPVLKGVSPFRFIFLLTKNNTTLLPDFLCQQFNNQHMISALSYTSRSLASCPAHVDSILSFTKTVHPQFLSLTWERSTGSYPKWQLVIKPKHLPPLK